MSTPAPVRPLGDRSAILLSGLCLVHCLALPLLAAALPWMAWFSDNESLVHRWLLVLIVPVSLLALTRGCLAHRHRGVLLMGQAGLSLLIFAALAGQQLPLPWLETALTVAGSIALSASHVLNLRALNQCRPTTDREVLCHS